MVGGGREGKRKKKGLRDRYVPNESYTKAQRDSKCKKRKKKKETKRGFKTLTQGLVRPGQSYGRKKRDVLTHTQSLGTLVTTPKRN